MLSKFMNVKRIVIPMIAVLLLVGQLSGCAKVAQTDIMDALNSGSDIEIMIAVPEKKGSKELTVGEYEVVQLDQLKTYNDFFRVLFDKEFNVTFVSEDGSNGKLGCMFINESGERDGNRTFVDSLRNKVFMEKYVVDSDVRSRLYELSDKVYTDVDGSKLNTINPALNAYFNLFAEEKDGNGKVYYNGNKVLTRADFYAFVGKASKRAGDVEVDTKLNERVKENKGLNSFAGAVDEFAWLSVDNDGLRSGNYNEEITRAEALYLVLNYFMGEDLANVDVKKVGNFTDAKEAGDMLNFGDQALKIENKETKEVKIARGWQLGVLSKMLKSKGNEVNTDLFKALGLAKEIGLIGNESGWRNTVTKHEAIDMLVGVNEVLNKRVGYLTSGEYGTMAGGKVYDGVEQIEQVEIQSVNVNDPNENPLIEEARQIREKEEKERVNKERTKEEGSIKPENLPGGGKKVGNEPGGSYLGNDMSMVDFFIDFEGKMAFIDQVYEDEFERLKLPESIRNVLRQAYMDRTSDGIEDVFEMIYPEGKLLVDKNKIKVQPGLGIVGSASERGPYGYGKEESKLDAKQIEEIKKQPQVNEENGAMQWDHVASPEDEARYQEMKRQLNLRNYGKEEVEGGVNEELVRKSKKDAEEFERTGKMNWSSLERESIEEVFK